MTLHEYFFGTAKVGELSEKIMLTEIKEADTNSFWLCFKREGETNTVEIRIQNKEIPK